MIIRNLFIGTMFLFMLNQITYKKVNDQKVIQVKRNRISKLIKRLHNGSGKDIMVVAHRGDWRNAPENSLQAIQNCIKMGVDIVEIDVRKTKDDELVIIHDQTLNRTTTGDGFVSDWTLEELRELNLKNGAGRPTNHKIPTLREALLIAKDQILLNLDKSYDYFDFIYPILLETQTEDQVIFKGINKNPEEVRTHFGDRLDSILYMPVINLDEQKKPYDLIQKYQKVQNPIAFELIFSKEEKIDVINLEAIKLKGSRIWVNSLWSSLNSGYEDDMAVQDPEFIYGWYLNKGINMIQTDRPKQLLEYLKMRRK